MNTKFTWLKDNLYLGNVLIGAVFYSAFVSRTDPNKYVATSYLPKKGKPFKIGNFEEKKEAKEALETETLLWIKKAFGV